MRRRCFISYGAWLCIALFPALLCAEAPKRVVSLKPSITDTVYALGLGDRLVGITRYGEVPQGMPQPAIIGDYTRPSLERIIALAPDLVLGSKENSSRKSIEALKRLGLRVELFPFGTLEETIASIQGIATALGAHKQGVALAATFTRSLEKLRGQSRGQPVQDAIVIWGIRPLIAAGPGSYMDELLPFIGARNSLQGTIVRYPKIGLEKLIALSPDIIIDLSMDVQEGHASSARPWDGIVAIPAVRKGRVIAMRPEAFRAGPNLPRGMEALEKRIHER